MIAKYGNFEFALAERYRFEDELGRGAMGTVYLAKDVRLGRPVAIKMLHPALTNELGVKRFQAEIRIAAGLHHPNIIGVHESGEADGRLFYVMDYLGGETLRARLQREKQLSVEDAIRITEQVAEGLQYAHDHGVVHRDVKPENIILAEGRACVVDFGLARALGDVDAQRLTASGLAVGTPHYLSPEQAGAEREIGPAADQYGLACVLYEMLVGEPPFTGPTASAIAMRHISEAAPGLRARRKAVTAGLDAAVRRAMEKVPADRFGSVKDFVLACRAPVSVETAQSLETSRALRARLALIVGLVAIVALISGALTLTNSTAADAIDSRIRSLTGRALDSTKYVILPFASSGLDVVALDAQSRLGDAIARWSGVSIPGPVELQAALNGRNVAAVTPEQYRAIARALRARWYVMGVMSKQDGSLRIRAEIHDLAGGIEPRSADVSIPAGSSSPDSAFAHLAYLLLFSSPEGIRTESAAAGTRSHSGFQKYLQGKTAMRAWNLPLADTLFGASLRFDADFPQASLALAQERSWAADISAEVGRLARRALDKASALSAEDKIHAAALNDLASKRWAVACARYDSLIKRDSLDFAGWYGLAQCSRWDDAVVADRNAPSGLRFRGSHQRAVAAVERAFDLLPSIDACCIARAAAVIRSFFPYAGSAKVRFGFGQVPDATVYGAYPELNADTLAFTPISIRFLNRPPPPTMPLAVRQQRNQFYAMASKRVALATGNADALELLGEAMELRGDAAAAETVHRARGLAANRSQALRLAVTEIWLRLKYALPSNEKEIVAVRTLADSLLVSAQDASGIDATRLASVAALVSNVDMAARLSERIDSQSAQLELPQDVMASAKAFVVRAVMGGPPDSLRALEARVTNGITNGVLPQHQTMMRAMWLARGSALAFHVYRSPAFKALDTTVALIGAEAAVMRGDKRRARDILMRAQQARANVPPANVTLDALYPEAWLLASLGDSSAALARIAPTLDALRSIPSEQLADAVIAGSLMQSMRLRQSLLTSAGDRRGGQEWARAVGILTNPAHASTSRLP